MNNQVIRSIVKKETKSLLGSKKVWFPMVIVPFLICVLIPILMVYNTLHGVTLPSFVKEIEKAVDLFSKNFPPGVAKDEFLALKETKLQIVFVYTNVMMIPFFFMSGILNSMVISSNAFAGEKERKTLETLLLSPITIKELFLGKIIAAFMPSLLITYSAFLISAISINVIAYPFFHSVFFLSTTWALCMFWIIPLMTLLNIGVNIFISSKVKTFQEAQQFGSLMVLPIIGLITSQSNGLFFLEGKTIFLIGVVILLLNGLLLFWLIKHTKRDRLFESQIH